MTPKQRKEMEARQAAEEEAERKAVRLAGESLRHKEFRTTFYYEVRPVLGPHGKFWVVYEVSVKHIREFDRFDGRLNKFTRQFLAEDITDRLARRKGTTASVCPLLRPGVEDALKQAERAVAWEVKRQNLHQLRQIASAM